ncbi:MAG TPA: DeoR/GlpR family DNA-binding transcription regulator [Thermotogota bacterium]|nr:DeoR/GlpR family DNA-binding transcription regulator [Thermotogota bacterium]HPJ88291.1 DeoR/GlpR family DNA-binding transcription regulator [Thermotogota bacterium]HPR95362.1 DeoR/GlpR family DNA-binding transcription regulator [Thermotogota bacterium]
MPLTKVERQKEILDILKKQQKMTPEAFSEMLDVSITTLRRDFKDLKDQGKIFVGYGYIQSKEVVISDNSMNIPFLNRLADNNESKKRVVKKALEYVKEDDLLFIGEGTTCYLFTKQLIKNFSSLKIITNGLYALNALSKVKRFTVEGIGGSLLTDFNSFVGPKAESMVETIYVEKFFFSCGAYRDGTYELSPFTASLKRKMLNNSKEHYLIIDSNKFDAIAPFYMAKPCEIDRIITDDDEKERAINKTIGKNAEVQP